MAWWAPWTWVGGNKEEAEEGLVEEEAVPPPSEEAPPSEFLEEEEGGASSWWRPWLVARRAKTRWGLCAARFAVNGRAVADEAEEELTVDYGLLTILAQPIFWQHLMTWHGWLRVANSETASGGGVLKTAAGAINDLLQQCPGIGNWCRTARAPSSRCSSSQRREKTKSTILSARPWRKNSVSTVF